MAFTLQTIPPSLVAASEARGGWTTVTDRVSPADDEIVLDAVKSIADQFEILGASRNSNLPYLYMNDCYADQNPLAQYPTTNIRTSKEVAAKYDPTEVFQLLQKDGFLPSRL
ncbi:086d2f16-decd-4831-96cc-108f93ae92f2 [Sclerotinia trifoliorum]|uniref:086d2f16-decd-4831-96cc-108f93ae92f2 n=1 Tax=Sclerotinia trifoliorum TaxID=28548 RepID=A0A8H2VP86_9HELO|nr:086d2f16-decd-4831-96cc-108f93ae92f2 [Sclerotinia trifoliorum]